MDETGRPTSYRPSGPGPAAGTPIARRRNRAGPKKDRCAMPISRVDLPYICNLTGDLLRLLEDLPSAMRALNEAKAKGQFDPNARSPSGFVAGTPREALETVRDKLLKALTPSKDDNSRCLLEGDSDITDSDLDLKQK